MKIRFGFVANSSSCSFSLVKKMLSPLQIDIIKNHIKYALLFGYDNHGYGVDEYQDWNIKEFDDSIVCDTTMDNFDLSDFLIEVIKVPESAFFNRDHS